MAAKRKALTGEDIQAEAAAPPLRRRLEEAREALARIQRGESPTNEELAAAAQMWISGSSTRKGLFPCCKES